MFKNDSELIAMLDFLEFDYEMDSVNPGIRTKVGEFISYDVLDMPSTYFEKLSHQTYNISLVSKIESENRTNTKYNPTFNLSQFDKKDFLRNYRMEFAA
ncbi:hypothetical protein [Streptococcus gordonii]|uniref:hypothetical protein n=1 Tax=Streptococcus gordonii TaxID=1302 RepID=UPI000779283E|nr:hypothetical protein [Streptococcus gordonii]QBX08331.1 hypothetical protein JavanS248_0015 [Streptococcus satellite phage Javan248]RSJ46179.1 hypothetical protein D8817_01375 [Streptococcus gordonii]